MDLDEQQLEQLAPRLGDSAAKGLNVEETARIVVARLKNEPEARFQRRRMPKFRLVAAAAVLLLAVGILVKDKGGSAEVDVSFTATPVELQALTFDELEEVLDTLVFEAPVYELAVAGFEDMSVGQLEELLQTMMEE